MKYCLLAVISFFCVACTENKESEVYDIGIDIFLEDREGNDLLDPVSSKFIDIKSTNIYYVNNNVNRLQYEPHLDCPSKICLRSEQGINYATLTPNDAVQEEFPVTLVQWSDNTTDTIKCHFLRNNGNVLCDKVWLNNTQVYPNQAIPMFNRAVKIVK